MLIVISVAAAATLAVVAYAQIQRRSPEAGTAGLRMVRELAAVVLVCTKSRGGHRRCPLTPAGPGRTSSFQLGLPELLPRR